MRQWEARQQVQSDWESGRQLFVVEGSRAANPKMRWSAQVNMRGNLSEEYRARHPRAPVTVQWATGVLLPEPLRPSNGSWSPRLAW